MQGKSGNAPLRLDRALVERGLMRSRSRALDAIARGCVQVNGETAAKPGRSVRPEDRVEVADPGATYVSRGALKLLAALDTFGFVPMGRIGLDLGASTGGFTQVLLERGAVRVHAVDVGHDQLDPALRADPRVLLHEGLNARDLALDHLGERPGALVADLSFISLRTALPAALCLAEPGAWGAFLVKPQFELGPDALGKGGIVRDPKAGEDAARALARWLEDLGWQAAGLVPSPIKGGDGNQEFLLGARRG